MSLYNFLPQPEQPPEPDPYQAQLEQQAANMPAMPNDYWSRVGMASGGQPFGPINVGRKMTGLEALLALASGFVNAKAAGGLQRVQQAQVDREAARKAASQLATFRHQERLAEQNRAAAMAQAAATQAAIAGRKPTPEEIQAEARARKIGSNLADREVPPPSSAVEQGSMSDAKTVAEGIYDGTVPPTYVQTTRPTKYSNAIVSELRRLDPRYSLTRSQLDYSGVLQFVKTLNQSQQVQLRQRAENARVTSDFIDELVQEIKAKAPPRTPVTVINKYQLAAIKNGAWGPEAANAATKLSAQIAAYKLEMAGVYSGGYAPQQEHLKQANDLIGDNWSLNRIESGLAIGRRDTNIRLNAVNTTGAVTPSNPLEVGANPNPTYNIGPNPMVTGPPTPAGPLPAGDRIRITRNGIAGTILRKDFNPKTDKEIK